MSIVAAPSATFEAVCTGFATGLTGTLGVRLLDNAGATTTARVTAGIAEYPSGSGIYYVTMTAPSTAGQYTVMWDTGTVSPSTVATEDLVVSSTAATITADSTSYVNTATLLATLQLTGETFASNDVAVAVESASRAIDNYCGRRFYLDGSASARYYTATDSDVLSIHDAESITSVDLDLTGSRTYGTSLTTYTATPYNAAAESWPYTAIEMNPTSSYTFPGWARGVKVTAKWGWPAVPAAVVNATSILAGRYLKRAREAPFGVAGIGIDGTAVRIGRVDPDIEMLLKPYSRTVPFL